MENKFILEPEVFHPGVVDMDATYNMVVKDSLGEKLAEEVVEIKSDNKNIKVNGFEVIIPYELRNKESNILIYAYLKENGEKIAEYKFEFICFSEKPTLFDDFDTDSGFWKTGWYEEMGGGRIENSNMVLTVEEDGRGKVLSTDGIFEQAYGCFSSRIKMPAKNANVNCAFWLCTYNCYKLNPECAPHSGGEIDIVELLPPANVYMATVHWFGWAEYHKEASYRAAVTFNQEEYNIYSTVWTPKAMYWYVNGELMHIYEGEGVVEGSHPMAVLLQTNRYDNSTGWITASKPAKTSSVYYDWVKIHSLAD